MPPSQIGGGAHSASSAYSSQVSAARPEDRPLIFVPCTPFSQQGRYYNNNISPSQPNAAPSPPTSFPSNRGVSSHRQTGDKRKRDSCTTQQGSLKGPTEEQPITSRHVSAARGEEGSFLVVPRTPYSRQSSYDNNNISNINISNINISNNNISNINIRQQQQHLQQQPIAATSFPSNHGVSSHPQTVYERKKETIQFAPSQFLFHVSSSDDELRHTRARSQELATGRNQVTLVPRKALNVFDQQKEDVSLFHTVAHYTHRVIAVKAKEGIDKAAKFDHLTKFNFVEFCVRGCMTEPPTMAIYELDVITLNPNILFYRGRDNAVLNIEADAKRRCNDALLSTVSAFNNVFARRNISPPQIDGWNHVGEIDKEFAKYAASHGPTQNDYVGDEVHDTLAYLRTLFEIKRRPYFADHLHPITLCWIASMPDELVTIIDDEVLPHVFALYPLLPHSTFTASRLRNCARLVLGDTFPNNAPTQELTFATMCRLNKMCDGSSGPEK